MAQIDENEIDNKSADTAGAANELATDENDYEPYTDEERAAMSNEQRAEVERIEQAIEEFITNHPTYKSTDENRQAIVDYLDDHALAISPASLELCWEQLQDQLDLEPQPRDSTGAGEQPDASMPDASMRLATAGLARGTKSEESEAPAPAPSSQPKKKPTAWRNGKEIEVGS